ncbi:unnamed protein product [Didymodactylos carnosus]|uniref:Uncharacterized protein n=1 Tax=Didymodactylos carnosus TaxID=1234261 RepID=A0A815C7Z4_9BILA|nr:unnamed protein product [Didymodactylos carnosus]CAF1283564.1 unnamed protein product [Didymodactylos carnosus]CAF3783832.1 unnamed protein product [Didymodactylos carnosus]CAF4081128.1 unnamed protein product [Didymodactylos carnosus]
MLELVQLPMYARAHRTIPEPHALHTFSEVDVPYMWAKYQPKRREVGDLAFITEFYLMNVFIVAIPITFDDIPGAGASTGSIPSIYDGLMWTNAQYLNSTNFGGTGYTQICTSYCLWFKDATMTIQSINSSTTFTFKSCVIGAGWNNVQTTVNAYNGSTLLYTTTLSLTNTQSMNFAPNWSDLTSVTFYSTLPNGGYTDTGTDNLIVTI